MDLHIDDGESVVIMGRSGGGKSVLLKHLIGLLHPEAGEDRVAAVVEGFDKDGLSCVCAFVVPREPSATLEDELRKHCETTLPRFKQPRRYIFVDELPYTATGKVQRFKLREQLRAEPSPSGRRETEQI